METVPGDYNKSQSVFGQNSFLIARGWVSVPFNAVPMPFLVSGENVCLVLSRFCLRGGAPSRFGGRARFCFWIGRRSSLAFVFFTLVAASFRPRAGEVLALKLAACFHTRTA